MKHRCIVNVATGHYVKGQERLRSAVGDQSAFMWWADCMPPGSPAHGNVPYAFKAFALNAAADAGYTTLLWADACIVPVKPLAGLFERIERNGYWVSRNGWSNAEWTAAAAYADLGVTPEENAAIPHVVATAFGLDLNSSSGRLFFEEYLRLAQTKAFCGPWANVAETPCGGPDVLGHRHDQTAASVIAWRLGMALTDPPEVFAYKGGETAGTVLVADGAY